MNISFTQGHYDDNEISFANYKATWNVDNSSFILHISQNAHVPS